MARHVDVEQIVRRAENAFFIWAYFELFNYPAQHGNIHTDAMPRAVSRDSFRSGGHAGPPRSGDAPELIMVYASDNWPSVSGGSRPDGRKVFAVYGRRKQTMHVVPARG
jgi:hypothetical protein